MESFDIESLLRFTPPTLLCQKCYGLHDDMPSNGARDRVICQVCGVEYLATDTYPVWKAIDYFDMWGQTLRFENEIAHCRRLATIAHDMRYFAANSSQFYHPPMRCLLEALQSAQKFVHFTTYGMSMQMVGALRMTALRVPVRGIISNVSPALKEELIEYGKESPKLDVKLFERSDRREDWVAAPHQKIIVIDGLLAFKGAANLTVDGWRKAAKGLDFIEVVTDVKEVVDLHNRLFSRVWGSFSDEKYITMDDAMPL